MKMTSEEKLEVLGDLGASTRTGLDKALKKIDELEGELAELRVAKDSGTEGGGTETPGTIGREEYMTMSDAERMDFIDAHGSEGVQRLFRGETL